MGTTREKKRIARSLTGVHAVVTGGARGIGYAIAKALLEKGAVVTLMGRDRGRLAEAQQRLSRSGGTVETEVVDVARESAVRRAFQRAVRKQGVVGILVNNAGAAESAPVGRSSTALWERMVGVNLTGVFLCSREVVGGMVERGHGSIVTVASTAGLEGYPYVSAYCAAKHGAVGFSRALALELRETGVAVNAVCPHFTETELLAESVRKVAQMTGRKPAAIRASYLRSMPHGRFVKPVEVADVVAMVCEREDVTGRAIVIDGGKVKV